MKLNKFMIFGIILLAVISLSAVNAADEANDTVSLIDDEDSVSLVDEIEADDSNLESSDVDEICQDGENIVTPENFFDYFDSQGTPKNGGNLTFKGEFNSPVERITLNKPITITGDEATFNNMGITVSNAVSINGLTLIADHSLENLIDIQADNVALSNLNITYNVDDETAIAINVYDSKNVRILDSEINFESHITSDEMKAIAINIEEGEEIIIDSNRLNTVIPFLFLTNFDELGSNNLNSIRAKTVEKLRITNNVIDANANAFKVEYATLQAMLISGVTDSLVSFNNISMIDTVCQVGDVCCIYGISFASSNNVTFSYNNFDILTKGGQNEAGTAYPFHGASSNVKIIGNNITSKSNGPNLGIYVASLTGESSELDIEHNNINITGYASPSDSRALVSGIEIQNGNARISNNTIFTCNLNSYLDDSYIFGISYAQWMDGDRSFNISDNLIVTNGKYTISTIATKDSETTRLIAKNNRLQARDLNGSSSIYTNGNGFIVIQNNTDAPEWADLFDDINSTGEDNSSSESNSSGEVTPTVDNLTVSANSVWQGMDNPITVIVPNATGSVEIQINGNSYSADLVDGTASFVLPVSALNVGANTVKVNYNGTTANSTFNVLNGIVTQDNVFDYFNKSDGYKLYDYVPEGTTLDFRGQIKATELDNFSMYITKAVNIISTTEDAFIDLNTIAGSYEASNPGNRFAITKGGSYTNVTGITLHNTQVWLANTDYVTLDNISVIVEGQRVGSGVGVTSIRENSSYITVKNSNFFTSYNGGSSTLVLGWANHCTIDNNIIRGDGEVGNLFYLNTYNVDIPDGSLINSYNTITNNQIYGPTTKASICRAMCYMGSYNLFENNTIYYVGEGFSPADNAGTYVGNIVINNKFLNGASMTVSQGMDVYNNTISGKVTLNDNAVIFNCTMGGIAVKGSNAVAYNNKIDGEITTDAISDSQIKDSTINGDISIASNGENILISGNTIKGTLTIKGMNNVITDNHITSSGDYAVVIDSKAKNNNVTLNYLFSSDKYGNEAVNNKTKGNFISNNFPNSAGVTVLVEDIKVGADVLVKVWINQDSNGTVKVKFNGEEHAVDMNNGFGTYAISNLPAGNYTVVIEFSGDDEFANETINKTFKVSKWTISLDDVLSTDFSDIYNPKFTFSSANDVTGIFNINGGIYNVSENIINGQANAVINNVAPGNYQFTITYSGDDKYETASKTVSLNVPKHDSFVSVDVNDIYIGNVAVFNVTVPAGATGNVTVIISGKEYNAAVTNGKAIVEVHNLAAGNYDVTVRYTGDDNYAYSENTTSLSVNKFDLPDDCITLNGYTVEINAPSDALGNLTVNGQSVAIVNGKANVTLSLTPGSYNILAVYSGDDKYNTVSKSFQIDVPKYDSTVSATVEDIFVGDVAVFNVTVPADATGNVSIIIGEKEFNGNVINGKAVVEVPDLGNGTYNVVVRYNGDSNYLYSENTTSLTVSKVDLTDDCFVLNNAEIILNLPSDATGYLIVNGQSEAVSGGYARIILYLAPGNYEITANYSGDDKYNKISKQFSLNISKYSPFVKVDVNDIIAGEVMVFNVTVPADATGNVTVIIGLKEYSADVNNGAAIVNVPDLGSGTYDVTVRYGGDENYFDCNNYTTVTVSKISLSDSCLSLNGYAVEIIVPEDASGNLTVNGQSVAIVNGKANVTLSLTPGSYDILAVYSGDDKYNNVSKTFQIDVPKYDSTVSATVGDIFVGDVAVFDVTVPAGATGNVSVIIAGIEHVGNVNNGKAIVNVPDLRNGNYTAVVRYNGDNNYLSSENTTALSVSKVKLSPDVLDLTGSKASINLTSDATGNLTVIVDNELYATQAVEGGIASIAISNLAVGNHVIVALYTNDDKYASVSKNITVNVPAPHVPVIKLNGSDLTMLYTSAGKYKVLLTSDGVALSGKVVSFTINGVKTTAKTNAKGYAQVTIKLAPKSGKYTVSAQYQGIKVTNKVKVNTILSAKNLKVKKSAKTLKIKVTLKKVNGKYLKSKRVTLKFNKKTYKAKTNAKGVATFKIPKKAIKKLKAGKKYTYKATYLKDTIKKSVSVKK